MDNVVESIFGLSPAQIQQRQNVGMMTAANNYANQDPLQRAAASMFAGGGMLAGAGAQAAGMMTPEMQQAQMTENALQGLDTSDPKAVFERASQIQDPRLKLRLVQMARQVQAEQSKQAHDAAQAKQFEAKARLDDTLAEAANTPKPPTPTEYAKTLVEAGIPTGSPEFIAKMREYAAAKIKGTETGGASTTKVVLPAQENEFEKELGKGQAKSLIEGRVVADDAVQMLQTNKIGRQILDKGLVTGFGANAIVSIGQALKQAGINFGGDATANAQAYTSVMAQNVGKLIKQFGSGTGLSDDDREYATKMAGGLITVDEDAIRRVLDINDRAAKNVIALHNSRASKVKTNVPLTVSLPEESTNDLAAAARAELAKRKGKN